MDARTWMDSLSTAGRLETPAPAARPADERLIVEQWNAELLRFVERELIWNGSSYVEVK